MVSFSPGTHGAFQDSFDCPVNTDKGDHARSGNDNPLSIPLPISKPTNGQEYQTDDGQLSEFYADVESYQGQHGVVARDAQLAQNSGKAKNLERQIGNPGVRSRLYGCQN